jgi:hypothetical protein
MPYPCQQHSYPMAALFLVSLTQAGLSCEAGGGGLAVSGGAPVTAAVRGQISDCGRPVADADVVVLVQQNTPEQARPVDAEIGPVSTDREGRYLVEVGPSFAVPGQADVQLRVTAAGISVEFAGASLEFSLGEPPRDTVRLDADLGLHRGSC